MPENSGTISQPRLGFLREGWRELRRKMARRKLRQQAQQQERERNGLLTDLGRQAWQTKIDLSAFPDLRAQLEQLDARAGELGATTKNLESEGAALAERRATEAAKFDGQRRPVEERKQPVDAALQSARAQHAGRVSAVEQIQARLAAISRELAALEQQLSPAVSPTPEQQGQHAAALAKQQQLLAEQTKLAGDLPRAQAELPGSAAEVNRLTADAQKLAEEIRQIEAARQAVMSEIDTSLARIRSQLQGSQQQAAALEKERNGRFAALGLGLYSQKAAAAVLAEPMQKLASLDQASAATQAALESSLAQTQAMPRGTMVKFLAVTLLVPAVMFAAAVGVYSGLNQAEPSSGGERRQGTISVPPRRHCEPLKRACQHLQRWQACALAQLADILNDVNTARAQLDAEWAPRSAPPEQAAIFHPQYVMLRQQLDMVQASVIEVQSEVAAAVAAATVDCGLLPGPEDPAQCQEAAKRVEQKIKEARDKMTNDLDTKLAGPKSILQAQSGGWNSIVVFLGQLQMRLASLQQCP